MAHIFKGTQFKINVSMEAIDGNTMADIDFTCTFRCGNKKVTVGKSDMVQVDDSNYVALLDSSDFGTGKLYMTYTAEIPDDDFDDSYRTEVVTVNTGLEIWDA